MTGSPFRFVTDKLGKARLKFNGMTFGYGDSNPYVVWRGKRYLVMKKPGTMEWASRGESAYYAASYTVLEYESCAGQKWPMGGELMDPDLYRVVREVREAEPGHQWCRVRDELVVGAKALDRQYRT